MFEDVVSAAHADMLDSLNKMKRDSVVAGLDPAITSIGVRVKTTQHGWVVLIRTLFNWRLLDCRNDPLKGSPTEYSGWARAWCYAEPYSFHRSLLAAAVWSGDPDTEPSGWIKSLPDERRHGEPLEGIAQE